jgi:hypothetical protein
LFGGEGEEGEGCGHWSLLMPGVYLFGGGKA